MIAAEDVALVLLAAGQSSRFPGGNKLEQMLLGQPIGLHALAALANIPFHARFVVTDTTTLDFAGCEIVRNGDAAAGMARSLRLGVARAAETGAKAVLLALADMPRITATHVYRLLDAASGDDAVVTSSDGVSPCPPAVFGRGRFYVLQALTGDRGARDLVRAGRHVVASPAELIDIDTPDDLKRLRALVHSPEQYRQEMRRRTSPRLC